MIKLIENEIKKCFLRKSTLFFITFIIISILFISLYLKMTQPSNSEYKNNLETKIEELNESNKEINSEVEKTNSSKFKEIYSNMYDENKEQITILTYAMNNNITYNINTADDVVSKALNLSFFIIVFIIVISSNCICNEFSSGTIKYLLIRPVKRYKILLCKFCTILFISFITMCFIFLFSYIVGICFFGVSNGQTIYIDSLSNLTVRNMLYINIQKYISNFCDLLLISAFVFMISTLFINNALSIIFTIITYIGGNMLCNICKNNSVIKYTIFANMDLSQYLPQNTPKIQGNNLTFSIIILLVYFILFYSISNRAFKIKEI